jgi:hypothetical protein
METAVAARIYQRFFEELAARGEEGRRLAEELRHLHQEGHLRDERILTELYLRSAQSAS